MIPINKQIADMVGQMPETEQMLVFELVKRLVPDDIATAADKVDIAAARKEYRNGETVSHDAINWN